MALFANNRRGFLKTLAAAAAAPSVLGEAGMAEVATPLAVAAATATLTHTPTPLTPIAEAFIAFEKSVAASQETLPFLHDSPPAKATTKPRSGAPDLEDIRKRLAPALERFYHEKAPVFATLHQASQRLANTPQGREEFARDMETITLLIERRSHLHGREEDSLLREQFPELEQQFHTLRTTLDQQIQTYAKRYDIKDVSELEQFARSFLHHKDVMLKLDPEAASTHLIYAKAQQASRSFLQSLLASSEEQSLHIKDITEIECQMTDALAIAARGTPFNAQTHESYWQNTSRSRTTPNFLQGLNLPGHQAAHEERIHTEPLTKLMPASLRHSIDYGSPWWQRIDAIRVPRLPDELNASTANRDAYFYLAAKKLGIEITDGTALAPPPTAHTLTEDVRKTLDSMLTSFLARQARQLLETEGHIPAATEAGINHGKAPTPTNTAANTPALPASEADPIQPVTPSARAHPRETGWAQARRTEEQPSFIRGKS